MAYDIYPAVDETYNFPPEVRTALSKAQEFKDQFDARPTFVQLAQRGILKKFANLTDLFADTALTDGDVAVVSRYSLGLGIYHNSSSWQRTNGVWTPIGNVIIMEANSGPNLKVAAQLIVTQVIANLSKVALPYTRFKNNNTSGGFEWIWNGAMLEPRQGFLMLRCWAQWNWGPMLNAAWTDPPLDVFQDPYGIAWANTNGFIAPATGKYKVSGRLSFGQNMDASRLIVSVYGSDGSEQWCGIAPYTYAQVGANFSIIFDAVVGNGYKYRIFKDGTSVAAYFSTGTNNTTRNQYTNEYTVEYLGTGL